jgi:DNA-binding response OmpR family regulator
MAKAKILIVEDDPYLGLIVKESFETKGFETHLRKDGKSGFEAYNFLKPDICILDVMMPIKDGFTLAQEIRATDKHTPIIFLTAKSLTEDLVKGFNIGANDYVKKPFSMVELIARVNAIIKRNTSILGENKKEIFQIGEYVYDYKHLLLKKGEKTQKITHREGEILKLLCENKNQILERKAVLIKLWGDDNFFTGRSMDVFISKLRKYLKDDPEVEIINVRGQGYKLLF